MATTSTKKAARKKAAKRTPKKKAAAKRAPKKAATKRSTKAKAPAKAPRPEGGPPRERDPRLPRPGAVLTRTFKGKEIKVEVLDAGFRLRREDLAQPLGDREGGLGDELERLPVLRPPDPREEGRCRVTARRTTDPRPVLRDGAVYWADNGRRICARCAGASALYTGHDITGQPVERVTIDDVHAGPTTSGRSPARRDARRSPRSQGADGWPLAKGGCTMKIDANPDLGGQRPPRPIAPSPTSASRRTLAGLRLSRSPDKRSYPA